MDVELLHHGCVAMGRSLITLLRDPLPEGVGGGGGSGRGEEGGMEGKVML